MKEFDHKILKLFSQFKMTYFSNMGNKFFENSQLFIKLKDMKSCNKLIQLPGSFKLHVRWQNCLKSL